MTQRNTPHSLLERATTSIRNHRRSMLIIGGLIVILLSTAVYLRGMMDIPFAKLFRDPVSLAGSPIYYGLFSQIGIISWAVAIGCLMMLLIGGYRFLGERRGFIAYSLGLTSLLALDDAFLLHENLHISLFGLPLLYLAYAGGIGYYLFRFFRPIVDSPFPILLVALGFLGGSMIFDEIPGRREWFHSEVIYFIEDGLKLAGIVCWTSYQLMLGRSILGTFPVRRGSSIKPKRSVALPTHVEA